MNRNQKSLFLLLTLLVASVISVLPVHAQNTERVVNLVGMKYDKPRVEDAANSGSSFTAESGAIFEVFHWNDQKGAWVWTRFQGNGGCQNLPAGVADHVTLIKLFGRTTASKLRWFIDADCNSAGVLELDFPTQVQPTTIAATAIPGPTTAPVQPTAIPLSTTAIQTATQNNSVAVVPAQPVQANLLNIRLCGTNWPEMVIYSSGGVFLLVPNDANQDPSKTFRIGSIRTLGGNNTLQFTYVGKVTPGPC